MSLIEKIQDITLFFKLYLARKHVDDYKRPADEQVLAERELATIKAQDKNTRRNEPTKSLLRGNQVRGHLDHEEYDDNYDDDEPLEYIDIYAHEDSYGAILKKVARYDTSKYSQEKRHAWEKFLTLLIDAAARENHFLVEHIHEPIEYSEPKIKPVAKPKAKKTTKNSTPVLIGTTENSQAQ